MCITDWTCQRTKTAPVNLVQAAIVEVEMAAAEAQADQHFAVAPLLEHLPGEVRGDGQQPLREVGELSCPALDLPHTYQKI